MVLRRKFAGRWREVFERRNIQRVRKVVPARRDELGGLPGYAREFAPPERFGDCVRVSFVLWNWPDGEYPEVRERSPSRDEKTPERMPRVASTIQY